MDDRPLAAVLPRPAVSGPDPSLSTPAAPAARDRLVRILIVEAAAVLAFVVGGQVLSDALTAPVPATPVSLR